MLYNQKWELGRQNTGYYKKLLLLIERIPLDVYLLFYPPQSYVPPHRDRVDHAPNKKHYRLNIILKDAAEGGKFFCENTILNLRRIKFFRSDINLHSVSPITEGTRYVLSIGFLL